MTRNVLKDHVVEIFANFGTVKSVEMNNDRQRPRVGSSAYVEYEKPEDVENAIKHMHGGKELTPCLRSSSFLNVAFQVKSTVRR